MAKCEVCGKGTTFGNTLSFTRSHVSRRSHREFKPNIKKVKALVKGNTKTLSVCTKCLRAGKITRAV